MKFISRFLAILFGVALGVGAFSWIIDQQLLQPAAFIKLIPSSTYTQLANALPATLGRSVDLTANDRVIIAKYGDATIMRQLTASTITSELNYWHGHSTAPALDLRPLAARLNSLGGELSPPLQTFLDDPQPITNPQLDKVVRPSIHRVDQLRYYAPLVALALFILIFLVAGHRRLHYLGEGCIVAALTIGAIILFNLSLPSLVGSALGTSSLTALAGPIKDALIAAVHSVNHQLIDVLLGLLGAAIVLFILQPIFGRHKKH